MRTATPATLPQPAGYLLSLAPSGYPSHPGVKTLSTQPPYPTKNTIPPPPPCQAKNLHFTRPEPHFQKPCKTPYVDHPTQRTHTYTYLDPALVALEDCGAGLHHMHLGGGGMAPHAGRGPCCC